MKALKISSYLVLLGFLLVIFTSAAVSAPLEIVSQENNFGGNVVGGEELWANVNFTNSLNQNLTFLPVLSASSKEVKVTGQEFDRFSGNLNGIPVGCALNQNVSVHEKRYFCIPLGLSDSSLSGLKLAKPGLNEFKLNFHSVSNIMPAEYKLEIDIRSVLGNSTNTFSAPSIEISAGSKTFNPTQSTEVVVNSTKKANLLLMSYKNLIAKSPETNSELIEALKIDVYRGEWLGSTPYESIDASGSVRFSYSESLDEDGSSVGLFYYNDSSGWINVTDVRDRENNFVYAEVDHFSTYAAFSSPPSDQDEGGEGDEDETDSSPGFGGGPPPSAPPEDSGEPVENETSGNQSEEDSSDEGSEPSEPENNTDSGEEEEPGQEEGESPQQEDDNTGGFWFGDGGFFTGFASQSPGAGFLGFLAVVITLLALLQYTGRSDVKGRAKDLFQRVRP